MYTDEQVDELIDGIYNGVVTLSTLPIWLYEYTATKLLEALNTGYAKGAPGFNTGVRELLTELKENIYIFSGAKTATQVAEIQSLMFKDGQVLTLPEFKKAARSRFETYNGKEGYLESEFITANTTASSAANFKYTLDNKELFPYLRFVVIMDAETAPECERMNNVIVRVDDPICNHNLAARHFRCRCHEERIDKYEDVKLTSPAKVSEIMAKNNESMNPLFKMNPVYDKYIFSDKHPYFDIGKRFPTLAVNNFNLPIPK